MHPEPLFTIGGQGVYLYGILIAIALIAAMIVFRFYTDARKMHPSVQNFGLITTVCAMAGGFFAAALAQGIISYVNGNGFSLKEGITAMYGFVGGTIFFVLIYYIAGHFLFKKKNSVHVEEFHKIFNMAPCAITIAHAIGRLGCLCAGCCYGKETDAWYGLMMDVNGTGVFEKRVPTQLFEALFLFALFAVLSVLYFKDKRYTFPVYMITYGIWRIIIELFRDDSARGYIGAITSSQFTSILFILGGIAILVIHLLAKFGIIKQTSWIAFNIHPDVDYQTKKKKTEPVPCEGDVNAENMTVTEVKPEQQEVQKPAEPEDKKE